MCCVCYTYIMFYTKRCLIFWAPTNLEEWEIMKTYVLIKWEYGLLNEEVINEYQEVELYRTFNVAHKAMVLAVAEKLSLLDSEATTHIDVSELYATIESIDNSKTEIPKTSEKFYYKLTIIEKDF